MWSEHTGYRESSGAPSRIQRDMPTGATSIEREESNGVSNRSRFLADGEENGSNVAIIGAGLAGLRCADVLLEHGYSVTIYEARNRLGGRVAQSNHLGQPVDLGPNWVHGTNENPIMELAKTTGTVLHTWDDEQFVVGADGNPWSIDDAEEGARIFWDDGLIAQAFEHSNRNQDSIDAGLSLYDFFKTRLDAMFTDLPASEAKLKRDRLLQMGTVWGAYVGSPVTTQSLKFFWMEECIEGENPFVAGTYAKILAAIAQPVTKNATIHLNTKVTRVTSLASEEGKTRRTAVETLAGTRAEFDQVVVTVPLGWLKRNRNDFFHPALPARLDRAITNIGYGCLDKVYIRFATAFWDTAQSSSSTHFPGAMHWLPPSYTSETNPQGWDIQGMNFAALPGPCAQPTILFYIHGDCSRHIAELALGASASDASTQAERDADLIRFFQPYFSRLPGYEPSNAACQPVGVLATAWAADELAGHGSYANFQVGLEHGAEDVETMRHGMPERGVWLAGEHTAPFVALGTTTGAYWSGQGVAKRIIAARHSGPLPP